MSHFPPRTNHWQSAYEEVISDSQYSVRLDRISDARNAILDRAEEILTRPSTEERRAMTHALRTLRLLEETANREHRAA